jgi:uncharacterized protein (TIGR03084 family)
MPDNSPVLHDLRAERRDLAALLAGITPGDWDRPTPAAGWTIRHQIAHLATFDDLAAVAIADPETFAAERARALELPPGQYSEDRMAPLLEMSTDQLEAAWTRAAAAFDAAAGGCDETARAPWYGPDMSVKSMITARIMETWAHGQDVEDAGVGARTPTDRLWHVVFLGFRTLTFSYRVHGRPAPAALVRVELTSPSGRPWRLGAEEAAELVSGPARDFALVVTRRRHVDDTGLRIDGDNAREWLGIAQAYAGSPGPGRQPGQFPAG